MINLSRRDFTKLTAALMAGGSLAKGEHQGAGSKSVSKKNVIFVVVEDLRPIIGCYGDPLAKTPNIDRLAKKGVVFNNAFCQGPICNPSRTALITGLRPDTTGIHDNSIVWHEVVPDVITMPYYFKQNGYYTGRGGKLFHGQMKNDDVKAWDKSFMPYDVSDSDKVHTVNVTGGLVDWADYSIVDGDDNVEPDYKNASFGIDFLKTRPKDKSFFLTVGFFRPHGPLRAPRKYFDMYDIDDFVGPFVPENANFEHELTFINEYSEDWKAGLDKGLTEKSKREFMRAYYACTSFTDAMFGRLLDEIDTQNLWKDTAVVFVSDHGFHLGEHGWWNKNTLFDIDARVPLIVYDPDIEKTESQTDGFVELVDLYPTLADLCGLEVPDNLEGISFKLLLEQPQRKWKKCAYTQVKHKYVGRSVRTLRWRYTKWDNGIEELYDHMSDPGEYNNLINCSYLEKTKLEIASLLANGFNCIDGQVAECSKN